MQNTLCHGRVQRKAGQLVSEINFEENLNGFSAQEDMERAIIKMQKQLNFALSNTDERNMSPCLPSGSINSADGKTIVITNGIITQII